VPSARDVNRDHKMLVRKASVVARVLFPLACKLAEVNGCELSCYKEREREREREERRGDARLMGAYRKTYIACTGREALKPSAILSWRQEHSQGYI